MSQTIGKQLKEARMKQGLTLEDIAHETRILESSLRDLEEDNYSHFANPTYARSFLSIYSEYLEVDASDVIEAMHGPKGKGQGIGGGSLKPKITLAPPNTTIPIHKNLVEQRKGHPVAMLFVMIILVFLIPTVYFIARNAGATEERQRINAEARESAISEEPESQPEPEPENTNTAETENANVDPISALAGVPNPKPAPKPDPESENAVRPTVIPPTDPENPAEDGGNGNSTPAPESSD